MTRSCMTDPTERYLELASEPGSSLLRCMFELDLPEIYSEFTLDRPLFRAACELDQLGQDVCALLDILRALPDRCFAGDFAAFVSAVGLPPEMTTVLQRGSIGDFNTYCRVDAIASEGGFQVIEINSGSALGGVTAGRTNAALLKHPGFRKFAEKYQLSYVDQVERLANHLRTASEVVVGISDPLVAIIEETGSGASCAMLAEALRERGLRVVLGELSDVSARHGKITCGGRAVDVVLRYFFTRHIPHERDGLRRLDALVEAHHRGLTALFTPFDLEAFDSKAVLALLFEDAVNERLTDSERELVRRLVPRTMLFGSDFPTVTPARRAALVEECLDHRTTLVLKPASGVGGKGVCLGVDIDEAEWADFLRSPLLHNYVIQDRVTAEDEAVIDAATGEKTIWHANWGVFVGPDSSGGAFARALPAAEPGVIGSSNPRTKYTSVFTYR